MGMLRHYLRQPLTDYEVAELAYQIERVDLGIVGGMQDQYAATFGGVNFIEFHDKAVIVNPLRVRPDRLNELQYNLLLCYTGATRLSARIVERQTQSYVQRREEVVRALDAQKEMAIAMKNALLQGRLGDFGDLLHQAWQAKKHMDPAITTPQIDEMYDGGAAGGRRRRQDSRRRRRRLPAALLPLRPQARGGACAGAARRPVRQLQLRPPGTSDMGDLAFEEIIAGPPGRERPGEAGRRPTLPAGHLGGGRTAGGGLPQRA